MLIAENIYIYILNFFDYSNGYVRVKRLLFSFFSLLDVQELALIGVLVLNNIEQI